MYANALLDIQIAITERNANKKVIFTDIHMILEIATDYFFQEILKHRCLEITVST